MSKENTVSTLFSVIISGGATIIISLTAFIVNKIVKDIDENKKDQEKDLNEFKGEVKEQNSNFKKDLGEAFIRIRSLETRQTVTETKCDNNHDKGGEDGK